MSPKLFLGSIDSDVAPVHANGCLTKVSFSGDIRGRDVVDGNLMKWVSSTSSKCNVRRRRLELKIKAESVMVEQGRGRRGTGAGILRGRIDRSEEILIIFGNSILRYT